MISEIWANFRALVVSSLVFASISVKTIAGHRKGLWGGWEMMKFLFDREKQNFIAEDKTGSKIPENLLLVNLATRKTVSLKSICEKATRPILLNFGSCT